VRPAGVAKSDGEFGAVADALFDDRQNGDTGELGGDVRVLSSRIRIYRCERFRRVFELMACSRENSPTAVREISADARHSLTFPHFVS